MKAIHNYNELVDLINEKNYSEQYTQNGIVLNVGGIEYIINKNDISFDDANTLFVFGQPYMNEIKELELVVTLKTLFE